MPAHFSPARVRCCSTWASVVIRFLSCQVALFQFSGAMLLPSQYPGAWDWKPFSVRAAGRVMDGGLATEELLNLADDLDEAVNFLRRVVEIKARTRS